MATTRFGHLDDFTLKNSKVGIGTSTPTEALEVIGGSRSKDIKVTGIATLTSYEGFQNKKTSYNTENIDIAGGESGTLSGEIVIGAGLTMSVGTGATTGQGSIKSLKVSNTFNPPIGGTNDRPSAPKPGALYYNKDFRTIEYWDGNFWRQVDNTTASGRMLYMNGMDPSARTDDIYTLQIPTLGNATHFGNLITTSMMGSACSSKTRGIYGRGGTPSKLNTIEYVTIASEGNAIDFGDATVTEAGGQSGSSSTRGIFGGGSDPSYINTIDYIEMSTTGNAIDFGDLYVKTSGSGTACGNPTRLLFMGGYTEPSLVELADIQMVTIASTGNSVKFGDLAMDRAHNGSFSSSTRGVCGGGVDYDNPYVDIIDYVTIASEGNAIEFGSLMQKNGYIGGGASTEIRGVWCGGYVAPARVNNIQYVTIATTGNAADFGDLPIESAYGKQCSDSHGGLGGY